MTKQTTLGLFIFLLLVLQFNSAAFAQTRLGLNITTNINQLYNIEPEIGFVFEKQATVHSGFETGINYRTYQRELYFLVNNQSYYPLIIEKYISIPVSYKFYSKIINAGLGATFDYYVDWKQTGGNGEMTSYMPGDEYFLGLIGKISKPIFLGDNFILEPEIKFNLLIIPYPRHYMGIGLVSKFDLHKE